MSTDLDALLKRLHLPTVRRLYAELETRAEKEGMSYRDYLAALFSEEVAHRAQTRIERSVRRAHFPYLKTIDEFDFTFQTSIRLAQLGSFLGPELVSEGRCAILYGPTGTGKTHLSIAIAYKAIQNGFEGTLRWCQRAPRAPLARELRRRAPRCARRLRPPARPRDRRSRLLDRPDAANVLFHVVNERHLRKRPIIVTTNKPTASWGRVLHDPDLAEAILDRLLERGRRIDMSGPPTGPDTSKPTRVLGVGGLLEEDDSSSSPVNDGHPGTDRISGIGLPSIAEPTTASRPTTSWTRHSLALANRASIRRQRSPKNRSPASEGSMSSALTASCAATART